MISIIKESFKNVNKNTNNINETSNSINKSSNITKKVFKIYEGESYLREASLSTIERHTHNGFFVISSFRGEYTKKENILRHKLLTNKLKNKNLGYITLIGGYVENKGKDNEKEVTELSCLVPYRNTLKLSYEDFFNLSIQLRDDFKQDGVLYCGRDGIVKEYKNTGEVIEYGKFRVNDMAQYFSKIRGRKFEYFNKESINYEFYGYRYPSTINDRRYLTESENCIIPIDTDEFIKIRNDLRKL